MSKWIQNPLFPQIPDPTMHTVDAILRPYYPYFHNAIMEPWLNFQERRATDKWFQAYNDAQAASMMHAHVSNYAAETLSTITTGGLKIKTFFGKPVYLVPEQLAITIKKLRRAENYDEIYRSNYLTRRNTDLWDQRKMEGHLDVPRVIIGYVFLEEMTRLEIVVAYPRTRGLDVRWFYDMPSGAATPFRIAGTGTEAGKGDQDDPERGFDIVPKDGVILPDEKDGAEGA